MKKENTKQLILNEALRLFSVKGYESVSVDEIAAAVGIKAPSLYKHYKNKRDIFDHIVKQMSDTDAERAKEYSMPADTFEKDSVSYKSIEPILIEKYAKAMFRYWTEEEFPSRFRRLLTLEQYRDPEMALLYENYLSIGPLKYIADIFSCVEDTEKSPIQSALAFYAPMFLLYSVYDTSSDKEHVFSLLDEHIDRFMSALLKSRDKAEKNIKVILKNLKDSK